MTSHPCPAGVIIIEANRFVADDLAQAVLEHVVTEMHVLPTPAAAASAIRDGLVASVAFVSAPLAQIEGSGLHEAARDAGTRLVVIGGSLSRDAAARRGWVLMNSPFSAAEVRATLAEICLSS